MSWKSHLNNWLTLTELDIELLDTWPACPQSEKSFFAFSRKTHVVVICSFQVYTNTETGETGLHDNPVNLIPATEALLMFNEGQNWKADGINNLQILQIENLQQGFFSIKPIRRLTTQNYVNLLMAVLFVHSGYVAWDCKLAR